VYEESPCECLKVAFAINQSMSRLFVKQNISHR